MHTSSIYALSALDGFLLSAGGKSQLFLWRYGNGELMLLFTLRMKGDARLVSVQLVETSPRFTFLVAASDSRLAWYILKKDLSGVDSCISLTSALCGTPMMTKVTSHNFEGIHSVYAVSTSGALIIWPDIEIPTKFKVMEIEKAGLSALDVLQWSDHAVVVAGSESGRISAARVRPAEQIVFAHFDWHGATCTDMRIRRSNVEHVVCIVSIALDCRIALFAFSLVSQKIEFRHALVLNVANPSSFCFISKKGREEVDIAIVGSSLQIVSFTDLELLK
ncbi:hypothetical protein Tcan_05838 [Toxocara canis]|nr:hypothetical protein Tcan_05838 [Toxocara canis]